MTASDVHVVIVDDDPPVRRALARLLTAAGCRVSLCGSAEDFLVRSYDLAPTCLAVVQQNFVSDWSSDNFHLARGPGKNRSALIVHRLELCVHPFSNVRRSLI